MTKTEKVASLSSSKPALETQLAMIELQKALKDFNPGAQIEAAIQQLRETPTLYGELIAEQIVPVLEPLQQMIQQAQDVANATSESTEKVNTQLKASTKALVAAEKALTSIKEPKAAPKDPLAQALPWLLLANIVISLTTLATVLLRA